MWKYYSDDGFIVRMRGELNDAGALLAAETWNGGAWVQVASVQVAIDAVYFGLPLTEAQVAGRGLPTT